MGDKYTRGERKKTALLFFFLSLFQSFFRVLCRCTPAGVLSPCPAVSVPPPQKAAQEGPGGKKR